MPMQGDTEAIKSLEREFSGWMIYRDTSGLCVARKRDDESMTVTGEDWTDLRDEVIRAIWRSAE